MNYLFANLLVVWLYMRLVGDHICLGKAVAMVTEVSSQLQTKSVASSHVTVRSYVGQRL